MKGHLYHTTLTDIWCNCDPIRLQDFILKPASSEYCLSRHAASSAHWLGYFLAVAWDVEAAQICCHTWIRSV